MGNEPKIPDIVIGRLPIYLRALTFMAAEGQEITSSVRARLENFDRIVGVQQPIRVIVPVRKR